MTLRDTFVLRALHDLERVAAELDRYASTTAGALESELSLRWTVERGLLAGLGLVFQVADHILAARFQRTPETYEGLLRELHACGVIGARVRERLKGSGGFRNVLVHEYVKVDPVEVARVVAEAPDVFRAYARDVLRWMERVER